MKFAVRPMRLEDVAQATEIDREAFPTQWPAPSYRRELSTRLAHFLVAYEQDGVAPLTEAGEGPVRAQDGLQGLVSGVKHLFSHERFFGKETLPSTSQHIVGVAGFWLMSEEAHLTTIAVREVYRRWGIGESLLISVIDLAVELDARLVTLEVRASNLPAQALYEKYGFKEVVVRRGYYTDNGENAVLMSTDRITSSSFQSQFQRLKQTHAQR